MLYSRILQNLYEKSFDWRSLYAMPLYYVCHQKLHSDGAQ